MIKILVSLVCIGGAVASFFLFTYPTYTEATSLSTKIITLETSLNTADELLGLRDQLLGQYRSLPAQDVVKLSTALPDHARNINFIIDMEALLAKHNLVLTAAKVEPPKQADPSQKVSSDTTALKDAAKGYNNLDISMSISGTLADFTRFMADLEQNLRLTTVSSVSFKGAKKGQNGGEGDTTVRVNDTFVFDLSLVIYWLKK